MSLPINNFHDHADLVILAFPQQEFASVHSVLTNGTQYLYFLSATFEAAMTIQGACQIFFEFQCGLINREFFFSMALKYAGHPTLHCFHAYSYEEFGAIRLSFTQISGKIKNYLMHSFQQELTLYYS